MRTSRLFGLFLFLPVVVYACSDSSGDGGGDDAGSPTATQTSTATTAPTTTTTVPKPTDAGAGIGTAILLINEISPTKEWVELVNAGDASIDLAGWRVADSEKDGGAAKDSEYGEFEGGTLAPMQYALVQGKAKACPDGGQSVCISAEFGISKDGEGLWLVRPDRSIAGSTVFPADAGESWSRLPNANPTGTFSSTTMTPGAANVGP
jgi:hypothetical protein